MSHYETDRGWSDETAWPQALPLLEEHLQADIEITGGLSDTRLGLDFRAFQDSFELTGGFRAQRDRFAPTVTIRLERPGYSGLTELQKIEQALQENRRRILVHAYLVDDALVDLIIMKIVPDLPLYLMRHIPSRTKMNRDRSSDFAFIPHAWSGWDDPWQGPQSWFTTMMPNWTQYKDAPPYQIHAWNTWPVTETWSYWET